MVANLDSWLVVKWFLLFPHLGEVAAILTYCVCLLAMLILCSFWRWMASWIGNLLERMITAIKIFSLLTSTKFRNRVARALTTPLHHAVIIQHCVSATIIALDISQRTNQRHMLAVDKKLNGSWCFPHASMYNESQIVLFPPLAHQ